MTADKPDFTIHFDAKDIDPEIPQAERCPDHPDVEPETGFGLAGGGYGPYTVCRICGRMLSKSQDEGT